MAELQPLDSTARETEFGRFRGPTRIQREEGRISTQIIGGGGRASGTECLGLFVLHQSGWRATITRFHQLQQPESTHLLQADSCPGPNTNEIQELTHHTRGLLSGQAWGLALVRSFCRS